MMNFPKRHFIIMGAPAHAIPVWNRRSCLGLQGTLDSLGTFLTCPFPQIWSSWHDRKVTQPFMPFSRSRHCLHPWFCDTAATQACFTTTFWIILKIHFLFWKWDAGWRCFVVAMASLLSQHSRSRGSCQAQPTPDSIHDVGVLASAAVRATSMQLGTAERQSKRCTSTFI